MKIVFFVISEVGYKRNQIKKIIQIFVILSLFFCKPADPNYRVKPLQNTEYTGFISRTFFQAVVEVPLTKDELTILEERKSCFLDAMRKRDEIVIPILKKVAMENEWNVGERKLEKEKISDKEKEKQQKEEYKNSLADSKSTSDTGASIFDKKEENVTTSSNPRLNRGEFSWFLDSMFIYREDYSDPEKCSFIFRNIQENLFVRVGKTKLSVTGEDQKKQTRN